MMLEKAFGRLNQGDKPILHSDQGWQYRPPTYRHMLAEKSIEQSMSRKGNCIGQCRHGKLFRHAQERIFLSGII